MQLRARHEKKYETPLLRETTLRQLETPRPAQKHSMDTDVCVTQLLAAARNNPKGVLIKACSFN